MNRLRWLVIALGVLTLLPNMASAQPTVNGLTLTFPVDTELTTVRYISKTGVFDDDMKDAWQVADDHRRLDLGAPLPGLFVLSVKEGDKARAYVVQTDGTTLSLLGGAAAAAPPTVPTPAAALGLGGNAVPSAASAANAANLATLKGQIKKWALDVAENWSSTGSGREDLIQRYDRTPAATCESIAKIFEDTASGLADGADMVQAKEVLKGKLQTFYDSQKRPLRAINPATEDWQPYLKYLDENLKAQAQFQSIDLTTPAHARFVLLELAEAFRELRAFFLGEQTATSQGAGLGGANVGSGVGAGGQSYGPAYGSSNGGSGAPCSRCRKRRCRCSSLLFGH